MEPLEIGLRTGALLVVVHHQERTAPLKDYGAAIPQVFCVRSHRVVAVQLHDACEGVAMCGFDQ